MMRLAAVIGLVPVLLYGALLAAVYFGQRSLLFPASPARGALAEAGLDGFAEVSIRTEDSETLLAWWKPPQPGRALIVYFHGNGGSLWSRRERARMLSRDGRGVLLLSYRGYAGSTGAPSEVGLHRDADAAYRWLSSYEPKRIVLFGESLGSGVAVRLAAEHVVGGVVLDAPYTSTADVAKLIYWFLPVDLLMRDQFRSIERIGRVRVPLLILHGDRDGVIPIGLSETLFKAANEPKQYVRLAGVGHEDNLERGGLDPVRTFLDAVETRPKAEPASSTTP
jgi:fermentation-respiration switch protein FrsA (DUF1100 family)